MKKIGLVIVLCSFCGGLRGQTFPFQDTSLSVGERVEDLLSRLTLEEKQRPQTAWLYKY